MKKYPIYLGGNFVETSKQLEVHNPFNQQLIASTFLANENELDLAIEKALHTFDDMKHLPSHQKFSILQHISKRILEKKQHLAEVLCLESGKPIRYALGEIERAAQVFLVAAEESKRLPKEYISLDWTVPGTNKEALIKYFPVGLVAAIAPFNFPLNLAVHKLAPALAAGCPVILKPARSTPLSVLELASIIHETDLPKGAVSILPTDRLAGNKLVTDPRFKLLTFTGSPEIGWEMKRNAGNKKVQLELGGNAGVYVSQSADIDKAVKKCLVGGFAYSGQICIHVQRIYVHADVFDAFTQKFAEAASRLVVGNPLNPETEISSMIDEENAIRVENWVNEAIASGAELLTGGMRTGNYFQPTVLTRTTPEMKVCSLEVFGPVVTLEKVHSFEEGIRLINQSDYGLQAGIFTDSIAEMNTAFDVIDAGGIIINDVPTFRVDHMPYGGVKNSGLGREGVKYTIHEMMEPKILVKDI